MSEFSDGFSIGLVSCGFVAPVNTGDTCNVASSIKNHLRYPSSFSYLLYTFISRCSRYNLSIEAH